MQKIESATELTAINAPVLATTLRDAVTSTSARDLLPDDPAPYADVYFKRSAAVLKAEGINPWVRAQVMIRKGPGFVEGIAEAVAILEKYSGIRENGGVIKALRDGDAYGPAETLMTIEAPIQSIIALETMYLGVLSAATTRLNDGIERVDLDAVRSAMSKVVAAAAGRPAMYFGARHWSWKEDAAISSAAFEGGATSCSTDAGASVNGGRGVGTIPHVLENMMAFRYGKDNAVVEATKAFDRVIDLKIPRVALIDYNNREIDDSIATAKALNGRLYGVRVDTCGENLAQGALASADSAQAATWRECGVTLVDRADRDARFWYGNGVTVTGVYALRKALDGAGFAGVKIILSSGFADPEKVAAFVRAEGILGVKLFDSLGVGGLFPSRSAKMDIVAAGDSIDTMVPVSKAGRGERVNRRLEIV